VQRVNSLRPTPDAHGSAFADRVLRAVTRIPAGRVATYGDIAALAGRPGTALAVGSIMRRCRARGVPCHRVVAAGGQLGGFGGVPGLKRSLLMAEGIVVRGHRIRDFARRRWTGSPITGSPITGSPVTDHRSRQRSPAPAPATSRRRAPV
jgi:O-6-methylguanine DNA methyltransferase